MLILLISYTSTVLYYTGIFLGNEDWGCEKVMGVWNIEARRGEVERLGRETRGAVGAEGMRCGEGVSPPYWMRGLGREQCPLPSKCFDFRSLNDDFWCILVVFSAIQLSVLHAKTGAFGRLKLAVAIHCCISS